MNSSRHFRHTDVTHAISVVDQCKHVQQKTDFQLSEMIERAHRHDLTLSATELTSVISVSRTCECQWI